MTESTILRCRSGPFESIIILSRIWKTYKINYVIKKSIHNGNVSGLQTINVNSIDEINKLIELLVETKGCLLKKGLD